jgi:HSP20 family protein
MSRTHWNPFKDREEWESRVATMLGTRAATGNGGKEALTVAQWSPLVDIIEDEKEYLIQAELPDMKKEDVRLTVENEVLAISGERKLEKEEKGKNITGSNAHTGASCVPSPCRRMRMGAR